LSSHDHKQHRKQNTILFLLLFEDMTIQPQTKLPRVKLGIIGGSGLYHLSGLTPVCEFNPDTPWGKPSSPITILRTPENHHIAFLSRHGPGHSLAPNEVPYRANIAALKHLGVEVLLAFSAVGSLREDIGPGDFVLPNQVVDRTQSTARGSTFYENGIVAHSQFGDPFNQELAKYILQELRSCEELRELRLHSDKTLVCIEGPRFSSKAESKMFRQWGCDVINMTTLPEAVLAREAELVYQTICMSTDYDSWRDGEQDVTAAEVMAIMGKNSEKAKVIVGQLVPKIVEQLESESRENVVSQCVSDTRGSTKWNCVTKEQHRNKEQLEKLHYILPEYFGV
jgi:5'-methylthioadenosine phosphorylase